MIVKIKQIRGIFHVSGIKYGGFGDFAKRVGAVVTPLVFQQCVLDSIVSTAVKTEHISMI